MSLSTRYFFILSLFFYGLPLLGSENSEHDSEENVELQLKDNNQEEQESIERRAKMKQRQTVLITGASSGIGRAMAFDFAKRGYDLILVARSLDKLTEISDECSQRFKVTCYTISLDLSKTGAASELYEQVKQQNLDVDILVNNAGFGKWGEFNDFTVAEYAQMLQLNINFLTEASYLWLPDFKQKDRGGIINVASSAALMPVPYSAVYSASKSYVLNFSEALYGELLDTNVTVTCLCPSGTKTNFASVANESVAIDERNYESPEHVAKIGIDAFLNGKNFILSGKQKFLLTFMPRILSRNAVIKASASAFKKVVNTKKND